MPYTLRRAWPSDPDQSDDYVIRHDGRDVGRLYLAIFAGRDLWQWTIYINADVHRVPGVPIEGRAETFEEAKAEFRQSFERMVGATG